jgi:hypothetical protein
MFFFFPHSTPCVVSCVIVCCYLTPVPLLIAVHRLEFLFFGLRTSRRYPHHRTAGPTILHISPARLLSANLNPSRYTKHNLRMEVLSFFFFRCGTWLSHFRIYCPKIRLNSLRTARHLVILSFVTPRYTSGAPASPSHDISCEREPAYAVRHKDRRTTSRRDALIVQSISGFSKIRRVLPTQSFVR